MCWLDVVGVCLWCVVLVCVVGKYGVWVDSVGVFDYCDGVGVLLGMGGWCGVCKYR